MGEEGGRRPLPKHPGPRPAPASRLDQVPAPRLPPRLRTGCCARLSKPSLGGLEPEQLLQGDFGVPGTRPERAPPFSLPGGCPGDRDRHGLGPSPSRPCAARCGRMWRMWRPGHSSGRAPRGTRFLPFPGRSVLAAGGFIYAAKVRERLLHVRARGLQGLS